MANSPIKTPPEWIGIDTKNANKIIDETIRPIAESVDDFFAVIIAFEQFLQQILDFAITFLQGIKNPLIAMIQALIDLFRAIINDLTNAGFYFTLDNSFNGASWKEIGKFEGGYSRFRKELTDKLTTPKDLSRPDFSELTGVLTITAYASSDVDDWIRTIKSILQFLTLFGLKKSEPYPAPVDVKCSYYKTWGGNSRLEISAKEMSPAEPPEGLLLKWSLPSAKKNNKTYKNI